MTEKKWLIAGGVGVLMVVAIAGYLLRTPVPKLNAPTVAVKFLDDLRSGDAARIDAAYDGTGTDFKSFMGREKFRLIALTTPRLKKPVDHVGDEEAKGLTVCEFSAAEQRILVTLRNTDGDWRVEKLELPK